MTTLAATGQSARLVSITELSAGSLLSMASMRDKYFSVSERAVYFPDCIPACNSAMEISSSSKAGVSGAG